MSATDSNQNDQKIIHHQVIAEILEADLSPGDVIQLKVVSNSMKPMLHAGDRIIAEITHPDRIKCGDIVVIRREKDYLTHRVIHRSRGIWITKGDNNTLPDIPSPEDKLIGRVISINPEEGEVNLQSRKWRNLNPIMGRLCAFEARAFSRHPYFRLPFRFTIKAIQIFLM